MLVLGGYDLGIFVYIVLITETNFFLQIVKDN